uniref:Uncharacterized protein n=1 Tax=Alexandrium monilatum TaxID=311494 RepID=A0A6T0WXY3_9DINO
MPWASRYSRVMLSLRSGREGTAKAGTMPVTRASWASSALKKTAAESTSNSSSYFAIGFGGAAIRARTGPRLGHGDGLVDAGRRPVYSAVRRNALPTTGRVRHAALASGVCQGSTGRPMSSGSGSAGDRRRIGPSSKVHKRLREGCPARAAESLSSGMSVSSCGTLVPSTGKGGTNGSAADVNHESVLLPPLLVHTFRLAVGADRENLHLEYRGAPLHGHCWRQRRGRQHRAAGAHSRRGAPRDGPSSSSASSARRKSVQLSRVRCRTRP